MGLIMNFAKWKEKTESLCYEKYTWFILENFSDDELKIYWKEYKKPLNFIEWQALKYDIQRTDLPYY